MEHTGSNENDAATQSRNTTSLKILDARLLRLATLVVVPRLNVNDTRKVPVLDIKNSQLSKSFAYDTPITLNAPTNASDLKIQRLLEWAIRPLFNATYDVGFYWSDGVQTVVNNSIRISNAVPCPNDAKGHPSDLIEELMYNIAVSLLHNPLFTRLVNAAVIHADDRIQYGYRWKKLVGLDTAMVALTLLWVGVGA
ncbi:hypothetical protein B0H63DRAFT_455241 [Podospora didyma]|uniref:Uncharacterized protein n=1 Tax=Podospora didyma TaxID=330526 RepID=A0AAE0K1X4_9PEZI|nr:hypothetical protein B0H63DRAFT_455241 [Podospora didyma]